jgi:hypothetical protein
MLLCRIVYTESPVCVKYNPATRRCAVPYTFKGGYTLVTLPRIVTPYRDIVDDTRARETYQKLVTW